MGFPVYGTSQAAHAFSVVREDLGRRECLSTQRSCWHLAWGVTIPEPAKPSTRELDESPTGSSGFGTNM